MLHPSRTTLLYLFTTLCVTFLTAPTALAQGVAEEDAILIVPHGGVRELPKMTIEELGGAWSVSISRSVPIFPAPQEAQVIKDARVMPDGRILLSGIEDIIVGVSDPDAQTFSPVFTSENIFSSIQSGVVAGYSPSGDLARALYTDSALSTAGIYDRLLEREIWRASLFVPGARALLVQALLMPGARIITATNWRSIGVSGIDRFELAPSPDVPAQVRFATAMHEGAPEDLIIVPKLADLRDIMAIDEETLLVTTRYMVFAMTFDGTILWTFDVQDDPQIQGEFASARILPSGRIAAATFAPGVWTSAHPNHRIHWLSAPEGGQPPVRLATSQSLSRAPLRVTSALGTGGTGTFGYEAERGQVNDGSPEQLQLSERFGVAPDTTKPGELLKGRLVYQNTGDAGVVLSRLAVVAIPGNSCIPQGVEPRLLWERREVLIGPGSAYTFDGEVTIGEDFETGPWCAFVELEDASGELFPQLEINDIWEVTGEDGMETFPKLPGKDLSLVVGEAPMEPEPDMGMGPGQDVIDIPGAGDDTSGCGCRQPGTSPANTPDIPGAILIALGAMAVGWRRRDQRML